MVVRWPRITKTFSGSGAEIGPYDPRAMGPPVSRPLSTTEYH
jgi:hypothetical protein